MSTLSPAPLRILFVCTGNICRSPAAEQLLRHRLGDAGQVTISSAGTQARVDEGVHIQMTRLLRRAGVSDQPFSARQLTPELIRDADLVVTMTSTQRSAVLGLEPRALRTTLTLGELAALIDFRGGMTSVADLIASRPLIPPTDRDIEDPYVQGGASFRRSFRAIDRAVSVIVSALVPSPPGGAEAQLTVLESFPVPRPTTNPYIVMLGRSLQQTPGLTMLNFSYKTALRGQYDVFHVHWPEILVSGGNRWKKRVRQAMFARLLDRLERKRIPLVRTKHNLELPTGISPREVDLLKRAEKLTTLNIAINDTTPVPPGRASAVILHGHYRDWYGRDDLPDAVTGRIGFFGLVRRYKGVDSLITAFRDIPTSAGVSLAVAGRPSSDELADSLRALAGEDDRIELTFDFLDDDDLADHVSRTELVVLPYREMHNSGGVLTALSLGRPVLVPSNVTNRALREEVGQAWVQTYHGELTGKDIQRALATVRAKCTGSPDLSRREWSLAGPEHAAAFRRAIKLRRS